MCGCSESGAAGGGAQGGGDPRADRAAAITRLLHTPVYTAGDGRADGTGGGAVEDSLIASRSGEVLR